MNFIKNTQYSFRSPRAHIARGFIGQKQQRMVDNGPSDGDSLLLTVSKLVGKTFSFMPDSHQR
jgi:hypothetical protein